MKPALLLVPILLALVSASTIIAESGPQPDIVLLDSGGEIRGEILEDVPGETIKIRLRDGSIVDIPYHRIVAITDEDGIARARRILQSKRDADHPSRKWQNFTRLGVALGEGSPLVWASSTNGMLFRDRLFLGAGLSWEHYDHVEAVPIIVEVQFLMRRLWFFEPYVVASAGYALAWHNHMLGSDFGGMAIDLGLGARLPVEHGPEPCVQLGVRIREGEGFFSEFDTSSNSFVLCALGLGVAF
jgi:hypothetical protein